MCSSVNESLLLWAPIYRST